MGLFEEAARRRRAAELERRLNELDAWDRRYGLGGAPPGHPSVRPDTAWRHHSPAGEAPLRALDPVRHGGAHRPPAPRRRRRGRALLLLLTAVAVAGAVTFPDEASTVRTWATDAGRSIMGLPAADPADPAGRGVQAGGGAGATPVAPRDDAAPERWQDGLGEVVNRWVPDSGIWAWEPPRGERVLPPVAPAGSGSFAFLQTQDGSDAPVGFSPCGSVPVEVNPDGAPSDYTDLVLASLGRVSAASGLDLVLVGETGDVWSDEPRELGAPVLVSWAGPDAVPALSGRAAGMGGATYVNGPDGQLWHASGEVVLDRGDLSTWEQHSAVLDHELGHVLGLDHVEDRDELMAAVNTTGRGSFGPGDLAGLAALGAIACPGE